jgi:hypothetical protein
MIPLPHKGIMWDQPPWRTGRRSSSRRTLDLGRTIMSRYSVYRMWLWRAVAYLAAATVAGIAVASRPRSPQLETELD